MPLCHDPKLIVPFLMRDEPGTRSICNLVFGRAGARARWIRVDNLANPRAVLIRNGAQYRGGRYYMFAVSNAAAESLIREIPRHWKLIFAGTPYRLAHVIGKVRNLKRVRANYLYVLDPKRLVTVRTHRVGFLTARDAAQIAHLWANGRQLNYVRWRIRVGPSAAIRRNGKLAAWGLTHADGSMAMLRVLEEYRGQGMARSITCTVARRVMAWGLKPFLHINTTNRASIRLTESMGFERHATYAWFSE
jgi:ribosomal protein S18 acetylase RimI-like enzyme